MRKRASMKTRKPVRRQAESEPMHSLNTRIPKALAKRVRELAILSDRSIKDLVREALEAQVKKPWEGPARGSRRSIATSHLKAPAKRRSRRPS